MTTIVAIHGNGGGAFRFARCLPFVPEGVDFRPITLPGFASQPRNPALRSLTDYANYLHAQIATLPKPLFLLGTGIGGTIGLEYAQHFALDGLILHAPVGTRLDTRWFPRLMRLPLMTWLGQRVFASLLTRPALSRLLFRGDVPAEYRRQFFEEYGNCSVFGQMFEIISADWFDSLHPIQTPTALLWGELERVLSVDQLDDYKSLLPDHIVRVVPDWDHFPMVEQPASFMLETVQLVNALRQFPR